MSNKLKMLSLAFLASALVSPAAFSHDPAVLQGSKALGYVKGAQKMKIPSMNLPGVNAYFQDVISTGSKKAPITCGMFRLEKGKELVYTYDYDDTKIVLEGSFYFSDGKTKVKGEPGDVVAFPKGSTITFSTDNYGLGFACGQRNPF